MNGMKIWTKEWKLSKGKMSDTWMEKKVKINIKRNYNWINDGINNEREKTKLIQNKWTKERKLYEWMKNENWMKNWARKNYGMCGAFAFSVYI